MESYLIDLALMAALVVTALRSGRMYRELKALREAEGGLGAALLESEQALNRAAEAVVALKYEGVATVRSLEAQIAAARAATEELEMLVARAEWHVSGQPDAASTASDIGGMRAAGDAGRLRASLVG
ncbi:hypothetical protein [Jiella sp. M17.18]|uniref:hypothetical protein n=1 Tax=Jiella sp. M17.18 TaxID=3234247 RepID=UPI0034DFA073